MWRQQGRSSALDRAQEVLSSRRDRGTATRVTATRGTARATAPAAPGRTSSTFAQGGGGSPVTDALLSDLSDLSSVSSVPKQKENKLGAACGPNQEREGGPEVGRPLSSLEGGANRFLKRTPAAIQDTPKARTASSALRASQTVALSRLAEIENRFGKGIRNRSPSRAGQKAVQNVDRTVEQAPSTRSSDEQSSTVKRFVRNRALRSPIATDTGVKDGSTAGVQRLGSALVSADGALGVDSDSEDIRRLLGDSPESAEHSVVRPHAGAEAYEVQVSSSSEQLHSEAPPLHLTTALHQPPASPQPSSPFRFTGQAQFGPSPPCLSPSVGSACGEVQSLEELFPLEAASEDAHTDSSASSGHFRINVLDLDDLGPVTLQLKENTSEKVHLTASHLTETPNQPEHLSAPERPKAELKEEQEEEQEEVQDDYQSDFESVIQTETPSSPSPSAISEHIQGHDQPPSPPQSEYSYSNTFTSGTSEGSGTSVSPSSPEPSVSNSHLPQTQTPSATGFRDTAVQTHEGPDTSGQAGFLFEGSAGVSCMCPCLGTAHHFSPVNAHISYSPSMVVLLETLKQQLNLASQFISSSRELHSRVLQSLGPPNYTYTTMQDTHQYIRQQRAPRPSSDQLKKRRGQPLT